MTVNWVNKLDYDLGKKLDLYFSHYPDIVGKTAEDFMDEKQKIEDMISTCYKWETHIDESLVIITIDISKLEDPTQLFEEMCIFIQERIQLLKKNDYLIVIKDNRSRWDVSQGFIYFNKIMSKEYNINNFSRICFLFDDLIETCEDKNIALKFFYKVENDQINQLFFVNSFWIH